MPGFDGMGPRGEGPRTGGGFGSCSSVRTGSNNAAYGAGYGVGRGAMPYGGGRGRCFGGRGGRRNGFQNWGVQRTSDEYEMALNEKLDSLMMQIEKVERQVSELNRNSEE